MRLEKHHSRQHVQHGDQNYLNGRSRPWAQCFWKAHARLLNTHHTKTYLSVPLGRKNRHILIYIWKLLVILNWIEWMKGACHIWSRGRHFSSSLPGDRYLKLGSKSDLRAEISGSIVWYDALAPCPEVLFSFSAFYANHVFWVLSFAQEQVSYTGFLATFQHVSLL